MSGPFETSGRSRGIMNFDQTDFNELTRRAAELVLETADVPRLIKLRLGSEHELAKSAEEMLGRLETFVRELRAYDASADKLQRSSADRDSSR